MIGIKSPNVEIMPSTAQVNDKDHLVIGGVDTVELAQQYGTPLWILDERTMEDAVAAYREGLKEYLNAQILYAGKAFLCLAMCHFVKKHKLGLDVVSAGELYTAQKAEVPAESIYFHGNNKTESELRQAVEYGPVRIVVDSESELLLVAQIAKELGSTVPILLRMIPGVEPDTHQHTITGHEDSKFGFALEQLIPMVQRIQELAPHLELLGLHAHIGSGGFEIEPHLDAINVLADCYKDIRDSFGIELKELDAGGGLGIALTESKKPAAIYDWAKASAQRVMQAFKERSLQLPRLLVEPGRTIVGPAGVTLYRAGHKKRLPSGTTYLGLDGGMADNPRPITYQADYTAAIASRMKAPRAGRSLTLAGKYCESGDIIIKESFLSAETGDLIAVFGTGAYNYSQASNYNRTGKPACLLVKDGQADLIIERESYDDLLSKDRVPQRLRL